MKVSLNILERLTLLNSLPIEGNIDTMKLATGMKAKISFSELEIQQFGIDQKGAQISWSVEADRATELEFSAQELSVISKRLKELSDQNKLRDEHIPLWAKFVES